MLLVLFFVFKIPLSSVLKKNNKKKEKKKEKKKHKKQFLKEKKVKKKLEKFKTFGDKISKRTKNK